jgi:hypothetical protein
MTTAWAFASLPAALPDWGLVDWFYQAVRVLAVAGGVIVGWLVTPLLVRVLVRLALRRQTPPWVQTVARLGGAMLLGFLVSLIPLGPGGGGGFGWGGGSGAGKGGTSGKEGDKTKSRPAEKEREPETSPKPPEAFMIRLLGGKAVKEDRFYQVNVRGKDTAVNDLELRKLLAARPELRRIRIERTDESTDDPRVLKDLVALCKEFVARVETVNPE